MAFVDDKALELSAREVSLLEILLTRAGRMVNKSQIVDHLCQWGEEVSSNAIEVYVHRLRKKLEPSGVRIATVRGLGYCLQRETQEPNNGVDHTAAGQHVNTNDASKTVSPRETL